MSRSLRTSLLVLAALGAPVVAHAAPRNDPHARAAEAFRQAQAAFERRDFAAAGAAFEQAARLEPHPAPLLDAADAWDHAGDPVRAIEACDEVIAMPNAGESFRADAEACVHRLQPRIATVDVRGAPTTDVRVDGQRTRRAPSRHRMLAGRHVVTLIEVSTSHARDLDLELGPGMTRVLDADEILAPAAAAPAPLAAAAPAPPAAPAPAALDEPPREPRDPAPRASASSGGGGGPPLGAWIAFGGAALAGGAAAAFGAMTMSAQSAFQSGSHTQAQADTFYRDRLITNVAVGVAALAAATGVLVWTTAPRAAVQGALRVTPSTASLVRAEVTF